MILYIKVAEFVFIQLLKKIRIKQLIHNKKYKNMFFINIQLTT
jgi:hypothetical protein